MASHDLEPAALALLERFRKGATLAQLMAESASVDATGGVETALARCALVRTFDEALYRDLLSVGIEAPTFTDLVADRRVERLAVWPPAYCVVDAARGPAFAAWSGRQDELVSLSQRLADYYDARSAPLDAFGQRIVADPQRAVGDLDRLYREADGVFDLASCDAILRVLRNRLPLVAQGSPLRNALRHREHSLASRTLFADEYYRTVSYLHRNAVEQQVEEFLGQTRQWIFHLHGKGGTGKTMFVRWLIARRCVLEEDGPRIPVAKLDFDHVNLASFSSAPWLVLPSIAHQWQRQIEGSGFATFLNDTAQFVPLLRRGAAESAAGRRAESRIFGAAAGKQVESGFRSALGGTQVVVVLDTLEEPLLHHTTALRKLLKLFAELRKNCGGLRLVLTGRYNIADPGRLDSFAAQHDRAMTVTGLGDFTADESRRYLKDVRRVNRNAATIKAVHVHTRGNPLELSLFAELLHGDSSIAGPDAVRDVYPITRFAYLLDRIIKRIPDSQEAVRWLLRYAVVPRTFTRAFFEDVLAKYVPDEISGKVSRDAPNAFTGALSKRYGGQIVWKRADRYRIDRAWSDLEAYAAAASWIQPGEGAFHLQPEIVNPMRDLLQEQSDETFRYLHGEAFRHFERRARQDPARWVEHICEAIYHRFQLVGKAATPYWRTQLRAPAAQDPVVRERLAALVLGNEFLDDETLEPRRHSGGRPIIDRRTCVEAAFEAGAAAVAQRALLWRQDPRCHDLHANLAGYLNTLVRMRGDRRTSAVPMRRLRFLLDAHKVYAENFAPQRLLRTIARALPLERDANLRFLMQGTAAALPGYPSRNASIRRFAVAREAAARRHSSIFLPSWIDYRHGAWRLQRGEAAAAARLLEAAFRSMTKKRPHPPDTSDCLRRAVQAHLWNEDRAAARRVLALARRAAGNRRGDELRRQEQICRAQLALHELDAERIGSLLPNRYIDKLSQRERAITAELTGDLAALRLETSSVQREYAHAIEAYAELPSFLGQMNCHLKRARYYLEQLRHGALARTVLSNASGVLDVPRTLDRAVLVAWLNATSGSPTPVRREILEAGDRARVMAEMLVAEGGDVRRWLRLLGKVKPMAKRLSALRPLVAFDGRFRLLDSNATATLLRYIRLDRRSPWFAVDAYYFGSALAAFGANELALAQFRAALPRASGNRHLSARLHDAIARLTGDPQHAKRALELTHDFLGWRATMHVAAAERAVQRVDAQTGGDQIVMAEQLLGHIGTDSIWHIRMLAAKAALDDMKGDTELATEIYRSALESAVRSRNRREQDQLRNILSHRQREAALEIELIAPAVAVDLQRESRGGVKQTVSRPKSRREKVVAQSNPIVRALMDPVADQKLGELLLGDAQAVAAAARAIAAPARQRAIILKTADALISAFPWEIGLKPSRFYRSAPGDVATRETITWLQTALLAREFGTTVDGVLAPATKSALKRLFTPAALQAADQYKFELRTNRKRTDARVLVVRTSLEADRRLERGHGRLGLDIAEMYRKALPEASVAVVEPHDALDIGKALRDSPPTAVHIVTGFVQQATTREVCIDVTSPTAGAVTDAWQSGTISLRQLRAAWEDWPPTLLAPFVIVEAILPHDAYNQARQVLLRNAFCAELFAITRTRGVLATGFFDVGVLAKDYSILFAEMAKNASGAELHQRLWSKLRASFPPALFAADPDLPALV